MSDDKYADDVRLIDMSQYISLKRGIDIIDDAIIYHGDRWWKVLGNGSYDPGLFVYAEMAGSIAIDPEKVKIPIDDAKTYLVVPEGAPLQFRDGDLISTEWPDKDLIYVDKALRKDVSKRAGIYEKDEMHGLFVRRYDSDGGCYYAPVEAEDQGIDSSWLLLEGMDIILEWRPVNIAAVLREAI